ncbi:MAG: ADP-ribosylglycohydrolase family protein [Sulfurovum sp.]|nr:ADP-ribosylglycohydrolase family protein [Sulfurovum sp.]NNJ45295.1 ADP-ribosylglycohydrolase family protein [Sulfurovum sp.]
MSISGQLEPLPVDIKRSRAKAALINLYIGDALSMPVHWFYNPVDILKAFPPHGIRKMEAAPAYHPSSIMKLHSTTSGGRKNTNNSMQKEVVGEVILKDKAHLWGHPNGHYHHGLQAGENTLNAWWAKWLMNSLAREGHYDTEVWVREYIDFMTADKPAHPDTYAESCHRGFFANYISGKDPKECGSVTHDTPSMGALVTVAPLALALLASEPLALVQQQCREHVWLTHPDNGLMHVVDSYVVLLHTLLNRPVSESVEEAIEKAANVIPGTKLGKLLSQNKEDSYVVGRLYSLACYITDSWPSVCYLASKYYEDPRNALLINTNLGGENAHRGSVLGTIIGLASNKFDVEFYTTLAEHDALDMQINQWLNRFYPKE